ncbi:anaphase-promoting complex subunit 13 isoform X2 [Frankliniella occidentalis]|uniref:Anaphase-promoting complex subunit 13 n=1 Tax=Frankliniella occidentalis TaxID=133901 RepID=A0A6J1RZU6_FRAOC|nr:anaphase-promoting complex subunit 13 isoform X1 [Frankliniella occidentalis]XP_026272097.1 anaphase-promoting complex subunit 13 isoform X2 [Frankliniella occidentalis]
MDSQVVVDGVVLRGSDSEVASGHLLDIVEKSWREDKLPEDDIAVPVAELPDPESDSGDTTLTLKEQDQKWKDLALEKLSDHNESISS